MSFCFGREADPFSPPLSVLLDFLLLEFRRDIGRIYSTMTMICSAISAVVYVNGQPAGQHPLVIRFMRGVFQERPSLSRCRITWDPELVLDYIKSLGLNESLSLIELSWKLVILMLLASGQWGQALHLLDIRNMSVSGSRVTFRTGDVLKTTRPGDHMSELAFEAYVPDHLICVFSSVIAYLDRTSEIRGAITRVFLTSKSPVCSASRDTLRCTRDIMRVAGIDVSIFSPHSTRSAFTSKAALKVPLATIITTVGWASTSTFMRFYHKDLPTVHSLLMQFFPDLVPVLYLSFMCTFSCTLFVCSVFSVTFSLCVHLFLGVVFSVCF